MGVSIHSVEGLGAPFLLLDELMFAIPQGSVIPLSKHHFKFLYVLNGEAEHEIDGWSGRRPLRAGDICVAPLVGWHNYVNSDRHRPAQIHVLRLFLDTDYLERKARLRVQHPHNDFGAYVLHHFPSPVQIDGGINSEIKEVLNRLRDEAENQYEGFRHRVRALCMELIVLTSRRSSMIEQARAPQRRASAGQMVAVAKEYIQKHIDSELRLGAIAWHVGKGEEHLARVFKRETGHSVFDYVREMRVNLAKTYLLDSTLALGEIAEKCGFSSLSFFSRTFRQQVGMAPSVYRSHIQSKVEAAPRTKRLPARSSSGSAARKRA